MTIFIAFMVGVFVMAARPPGTRLALRRPVALLALSAFVAAGFYSARVVL